MTDFTIDDHGSIVLLHPVTDQARAWIQENLGDNLPRLAGAIAIDRQYIDIILVGLFRDDLSWDTPTPTLH
tara:strand:+ start:1017 stop:1229 length:213 start_codon:yes stop_codon:yes gene_type:complete